MKTLNKLVVGASILLLTSCDPTALKMVSSIATELQNYSPSSAPIQSIISNITPKAETIHYMEEVSNTPTVSDTTFRIGGKIKNISQIPLYNIQVELIVFYGDVTLARHTDYIEPIELLPDKEGSFNFGITKNWGGDPRFNYKLIYKTADNHILVSDNEYIPGNVNIVRSNMPKLK